MGPKQPSNRPFPPDRAFLTAPNDSRHDHVRPPLEFLPISRKKESFGDLVSDMYPMQILSFKSVYLDGSSPTEAALASRGGGLAADTETGADFPSATKSA